MPSDTSPDGLAERLECPWCENDQVVTHKLHGKHWAECMACEARGPIEYSEQKARAAWNRRTPDTSPSPEGLREAVEIAKDALAHLGDPSYMRGEWIGAEMVYSWIGAEDFQVVARQALGRIEGVLARRAPVQPEPSLPPQEWRERVARIADPDLWQRHDILLRQAQMYRDAPPDDIEPNGYAVFADERERAARVTVEPSLAKADAILSHIGGKSE